MIESLCVSQTHIDLILVYSVTGFAIGGPGVLEDVPRVYSQHALHHLFDSVPLFGSHGIIIPLQTELFLDFSACFVINQEPLKRGLDPVVKAIPKHL